MHSTHYTGVSTSDEAVLWDSAHQGEVIFVVFRECYFQILKIHKRVGCSYKMLEKQSYLGMHVPEMDSLS